LVKAEYHRHDERRDHTGVLPPPHERDLIALAH
jgi:hypothetical protein